MAIKRNIAYVVVLAFFGMVFTDRLVAMKRFTTAEVISRILYGCRTEI